MEKSGQSFSYTVLPYEKGLRLDLFLVHHLSDLSRSAVLKHIRDGLVRVNGLPLKAGYRVRDGEKVDITIPPPPPSSIIPEQVDFEILYEDESLLVVVKPPGLVVHPAAGHRQGTLAHGLLFHCKSLPGLDDQRPGLVHRLDKDTSGVMLVAKTEKAMRKLTEDFRNRIIKKTYHTILMRCPTDQTGRIVAPIGRHSVNRKKMAVLNRGGKYAATSWRVIERFDCGICHVEIDLETGRTHQIRVHMASIGCPVAGDTVYGGKVPESFGLKVPRQLLHASTISFTHPETLKSLSFTTPLWPDIQDNLDMLRSTSGKATG